MVKVPIIQSATTRVGEVCPIAFPTHTAYSVYVPRTDNQQRKIAPSLIEDIAKEISVQFGGVTVERAVQGCWHDPNNGEICDNIIKMTAVRNYTMSDNVTPMHPDMACETWKSDQAFINSKTEEAGKKFGQYSIFATASPLEAVFRPGKHSETIDTELLEGTGFGKGRIRTSRRLIFD